MNAKTRAPGPTTPFGFPTFSGTAGDRAVHWLGGESRADELEQQFGRASRLLQLMILNAYTVGGLTATEQAEARRMIEIEPDVEDTCWLCSSGEKAKAIGDTGLCRGHNSCALATRK